MGRPLWFVNLIKKFFPDRFRFATLTTFPLVGHAVDHVFFRGDDIVYLPKDHTVRINAEIGDIDEMVLPSQVVEHFIENASHLWLMNFCICREGDNCQDYPQDLGCLFLGEAVLKINPKIGRLVTKEEALEHARRCRQAGLVHMVGRNKLDAVWLGAGPSENLLTICNCCPCCCLWRVLPVLTPMIAGKITRMEGVQVVVTENCLGCGECAGVCFVEAITLVDGRAVIGENCRGCGQCVEVCPNQAVDLYVNDLSFVTRTIERISSHVTLSKEPADR